MKIVTRILTEKEAVNFSDEIKKTDNIVGYLPIELLNFNEMIVLEDDDGTAQGIVYYEEHKTYIDLKLMIIKEKMRGTGYGKALFQNVKNVLKDSDKIIYMVSRNPITMKMAKEAGFKQVYFLRLPIKVMLNQIKMAFSLYRAAEVFRKGMTGKANFTHWVKY